jgi:hypothetical protein
LFAPGDANELAKAICKQKGVQPAGLREEVLDRFTLEQMVEKTVGLYEDAVRQD